MRVLALVPGGIGDQVLFFPTLAHIKQEYPQAKIDVMVEPRSKSAYRICAHVNEVLVFDYKDKNGLADWLNLTGMIRDREYEAAISLGRRWAIGFLLWLNGIPQRVGYDTGTYRFLSRTVPLNLDQYAAWMYHDLVKGLGIDAPCPKVQDSINVPTQDITWAEEKQKELEIKDIGYVLIHGGSSNLAKIQGIDKIYPVEKWKQVIENIQSRQPDIPIVLVQGPDDGDWIEEIQGLVGNLKVIVPDDIGKLAAMIAGANLMICTDSAPMHLSIAVDTYTVALFGPTNPEKLLPPEQTKFIGVQSSTGNIADIEPEEILKQIWRD